jgi:hypothetical protein
VAKQRSPEHTAPFAKREGPRRDRVVGASVTEDEQLEILTALVEAGFPSASEGARTVLLNYARSATALREAA